MGRSAILESIAKEMQMGVLVLNRSAEVVFANPFFSRLFPSVKAIEGRPVRELIGDSELLRFIEAAPGSMGEEAPDMEISEHGRVFKARLVPVKEKTGLSLIVFLQDITEEKRVETIKKDFVANVSHELRTPLASIKGYSETLLDGGLEDRGTTKEFLKVIDRHATRMSRLIDDLLTLSRLESHQLTIVLSPVDIKDLVSSIAPAFSKQARDKGLKEIRLNVPDGLPKVLGDRDRLEQVLVNLLDNAIKYTPAGGEVFVSAASVDSSVRVDVRDTGIGIPPADLPRIFERFYRVDKARSREMGGTGLGLAIVKHIIQGHNGRLQVESALSRGSTFSFFIKSI